MTATLVRTQNLSDRQSHLFPTQEFPFADSVCRSIPAERVPFKLKAVRKELPGHRSEIFLVDTSLNDPEAEAHQAVIESNSLFFEQACGNFEFILQHQSCSEEARRD